MDIQQVFDGLLTVFKGIKSKSAAAKKASDARGGAYTAGVQLAVECGDWSTFEKGMAKFENAIRTDGKVAVAVGAKKRDKASKEGFRYNIPNSVMSMKSTLKSAHSFGIELTGDDGEARAFSEIKRDVKAANEAAEIAKLTGDAKIRHFVGVALDELAEVLTDDFGGKMLDELAAEVFSLRDEYAPTGEDSDETETETETDADAIADAA